MRMHPTAKSLVGGAVKALESRQVWTALIAAALAVLQASGVALPAHLPTILYSVLAAVFGDATLQKVATVHAATAAVAQASVKPAAPNTGTQASVKPEAPKPGTEAQPK